MIQEIDRSQPYSVLALVEEESRQQKQLNGEFADGIYCPYEQFHEINRPHIQSFFSLEDRGFGYPDLYALKEQYIFDDTNEVMSNCFNEVHCAAFMYYHGYKEFDVSRIDSASDLKCSFRSDSHMVDILTVRASQQMSDLKEYYKYAGEASVGFFYVSVDEQLLLTSEVDAYVIYKIKLPTQDDYSILFHKNKKDEKVKFRVKIEDKTEVLDARKAKGLRDTFMFACTFFSANNDEIFQRVLYLKKFLRTQSKTSKNKQVTDFHCASRNDIVDFNGTIKRVHKVRTILINNQLPIARLWNKRLNNDDDDDDDDTLDIDSNKRTEVFHMPWVKIACPVLYFVYDVETVVDKDLKHKIFCICCEYFLLMPSASSFNLKDIKRASFYVKPNQHAEFDDAVVINNFLHLIVDVANKTLDENTPAFWEEFQYRSTNTWFDKKYSKRYLQIRICGYNSSNYDDKFLIEHFPQVFRYHQREFTKRNMTINKHKISGCSVFGRHMDYVEISFQDILRVTPEVKSLSDVCRSLNISQPKISFNILKFIELNETGTLQEFYKCADLLDIFFGQTPRAAYPARLLPGYFKARFKEIFEDDPRFTYDPNYQEFYINIHEVVTYYCERDVTATTEILLKIYFQFKELLAKVFMMPVMDTGKVFYDYVQTNLYGPEYEQNLDGLDENEKAIYKPKMRISNYRPPVELSDLCDIFNFVSIAQISFYFMKILFVAQKYKKVNHKIAELIEFIKCSYFGGLVQHSYIGIRYGKMEMIDVKSEYPLAMTGPLPLNSDEYSWQLLDCDDDYRFIQFKIDECSKARYESYKDRKLHEFAPHKYIDFLAILHVRIEVPKDPRKCSVFSPIPFTDQISSGSKSSRYFNIDQCRVLTTHHICALILHGWTVTLMECPYNIIFNCLRRDSHGNKQCGTIRENFQPNCEKFRILKDFVEIFGREKADAAEGQQTVMKKLYKMILNAGAGRLGMKEVNTYTNVVMDVSEKGTATLQNTRSAISHLGRSVFELAVFINSAGLYIITRMQFLLQLKDIYYGAEPFWARAPSVFYTDTDSVLFDSEKILDDVRNVIVSSKEIGTWQTDHYYDTYSTKSKCDVAIIFGKKSYILGNLSKNSPGKYALSDIHSKGVKISEMTKQLTIDEVNLNMDLLKQIFEDSGMELQYNQILKQVVRSDLSRKLFQNSILRKKVNLARVGRDFAMEKEPYKLDLSFLPCVASDSEHLIYTHSPCQYINCNYCRDFRTVHAHCIELYNWKYDRFN